MESSIYKKPLTEDTVLYFLYLGAKRRNSKVFFKLKHNISLNREWSFYFAPDIDMLEITPEEEIIGYEAKGQQKRKSSYNWPSLYAGLDEALFYLRLPYVDNKKFDGGGIDKVFVVHAHPEPKKIIEDEKLGLKIYELTPIGLLCVTPEREIKKLIEAKKNPILNKNMKNLLLQNLNTLENFSENSRTFQQIKEVGEGF
jgi:hypothetical protein